MSVPAPVEYLRAVAPLECDDCLTILVKGAEYRRVETHTRRLVICRECYEAAEQSGMAGAWE